MDIDEREAQLKERLESLRQMEQEALRREGEVKEREKSRKQVLLRLSPTLWQKVAKWAEDDFRSINSQIEYILSEAVKNRRG
jgi:hypothetical protein